MTEFHCFTSSLTAPTVQLWKAKGHHQSTENLEEATSLCSGYLTSVLVLMRLTEICHRPQTPEVFLLCIHVNISL